MAEKGEADEEGFSRAKLGVNVDDVSETEEEAECSQGRVTQTMASTLRDERLGETKLNVLPEFETKRKKM